MNREVHLASPDFPKKVDFSWCKLCSILLYCGRCTEFKLENIIVDTVSTNRCLMCGTYFYVNLHTNLKRKNIFIGMVTRFKKQLACSVGTFLLAEHWNHCTLSSPCFHTLCQDIYKIKWNLNIYYISYVYY